MVYSMTMTVLLGWHAPVWGMEVWGKVMDRNGEAVIDALVQFTDEMDPESSDPFMPEDIGEHHKNWFSSIRENKQPNGNIDLAIKVQTVISLAEMSERMNVMCCFDEKTRKVTTMNGKELEPITYGTLDLS